MSNLSIKGAQSGYETILTPEALAFVEAVAERFGGRRDALLSARREAQERIDGGELPGFLPETADIRKADWQVEDAPAALQDRRVEITAPAERKKIILALNSAAKVYMADFEDSLAPTWGNLMGGQLALYEATRGKCEMSDAARGKSYALNPDHLCQLIVRPRGWHLPEKHVLLNGAPIAGAFLDFGLFFFHNAKTLAEKGRGPFFYLPKTESWKEAELWNDIMDFGEATLGLPANCAKATLLIETLPAVFQMDEILHAMKSRLVGLNCGRWDYIFSYIKTLRARANRMLPERNLVTMAQPLMRAYSLELIKTCHRRNAHAMGGMSAFIPIRGDEAANNAAMQKVREDKQREAESGHDGTWVAHPDLIPVAEEIFNQRLANNAHQKTVAPAVAHKAEDFLTPPPGGVSAAGYDNNIQVGLRYIAAWLGGDGAVPIFNLMEDAATAEIARAQLWQWMRYPTKLNGGGETTREFFNERLRANVEGIRGEGAAINDKLPQAAELLSDLAQAPVMADFLTLQAY